MADAEELRKLTCPQCGATKFILVAVAPGRTTRGPVKCRECDLRDAVGATERSA